MRQSRGSSSSGRCSSWDGGGSAGRVRPSWRHRRPRRRRQAGRGPLLLVLTLAAFTSTSTSGQASPCQAFPSTTTTAPPVTTTTLLGPTTSTSSTTTSTTLPACSALVQQDVERGRLETATAAALPLYVTTTVGVARLVLSA
jgi:hypothetical protein